MLKLITETEAAAIAQVDRRTIRRLVRDGRLRAANFGTEKKQLIRINPDDLLNLLTTVELSALSSPLPPAAPRNRSRAKFRDGSSSASAYLPPA